MNDLDFINSLSEQLFHDSAKWFGEKALDIMIVSKKVRRYSFILRVTVNFNSLDDANLVIKIPREPSMSELNEVVSSKKLRHEGEMESEILARTYQRVQESGNSGLAAIKVFGYYPQFCAIVMEELKMRLLKEVVTGFPSYLLKYRDWEKFIGNVYKSSWWLRHFHEANDLQRGNDLSLSIISEIIEPACTRLENASGLELEGLKQRLIKYYEVLKDEQLEIATLHNDYHLGNIFILNDEKIGAFDPNWESRGPVYIDIARLMIDLETRRAQVISFGNLINRKRLDEFKIAVIDGYFRYDKIHQDVLYLFCALELIKKWRINEEFFSDNQVKIVFVMKPVLLRWIRRYFIKLIDQYLEQ